MAHAESLDHAAGRHGCVIWHLRGVAKATRRLEPLSVLMLSAVSYLELLQGMRNKAELAALKKMLVRRNANVLPVSEAITQRAIGLMESRTLSHGLQLGDALIAATALDRGLPILTANVKHFSPIDGLLVEPFVP